MGGGGGDTPDSNIKVTSYGYDGDPYGDSASGNAPGNFTGHGVGNHENVLTNLQSLSITDSLAQRKGWQVGQQISFTTASGQNFTGVYSDTVPATTSSGQDLGERIDIYNNDGSLGGNDFSSTVSSLNGTTDGTSGGGNLFSNIGAAAQNVWGMITNPGQSAWAAILSPIMYLLSLIAAAVMWLMLSVLLPVLFAITVALAPLFVATLAIDSLSGIGMKYLTGLVSLCLWPLSFAIAGLVTAALVGLTVNGAAPGSDTPAEFGGLLAFIALFLWVPIGYIVAPFMISAALMSGSTGLSSAWNRSWRMWMTSGASEVMPAMAGGGGGGGGGASGGSRSPNPWSTRGSFARRPPS
jgi:hypothetical protein